MVGKEICQYFLNFDLCKSGLTEKNLLNDVVDTLKELGLNLKLCQRQDKDMMLFGAVRGAANGLSPIVLKEDEKAL